MDPNFLMDRTFGNLFVTIIYLVWFAALWFHLTHGFWSAFQTLGLNNNIWIKRWKIAAYIFATIICGLFAVVAVAAYFNAGAAPVECGCGHAH